MTAVITAAATVETVQAADRAALERFFEQCSQLTVYRRFFAPVRRFPAGYLDAVLNASPDVHDAVVVRVDGERDIAGLASLAVAPNATHTAELGVLVADVWQTRGLGLAMTERLLERARQRGVQWINASVLAEQAGLLRALARRLEITALAQESDSITSVYRIG